MDAETESDKSPGQWINDMEERLHAMVRECPLTREYAKLHEAIRIAEGVAFSMLPASRREELIQLAIKEMGPIWGSVTEK